MNVNISMQDLLTSLSEYRAAIEFYKTNPTGTWDDLAVLALLSHAKRLEREIVARGGSVE
jgi:hypothetical protein